MILPMILNGYHKAFVIKAFAQFMTRKQVVNAFVQEFPNDLPKPTHKITQKNENENRTDSKK